MQTNDFRFPGVLNSKELLVAEAVQARAWAVLAGKGRFRDDDEAARARLGGIVVRLMAEPAPRSTASNGLRSEPGRRIGLVAFAISSEQLFARAGQGDARANRRHNSTMIAAGPWRRAQAREPAPAPRWGRRLSRRRSA